MTRADILCIERCENCAGTSGVERTHNQVRVEGFLSCKGVLVESNGIHENIGCKEKGTSGVI